MGAIIMKIDFATLAFGHKVKVGGSTPNWATALGQGKKHKINDDAEIDELLRGMTFSAVPLERVSTKIGKGGNVVYGNVENSPVVLAALFKKVYINDVLIKDGQYILLITRDTSLSHAGRLRVKYGPSNTYYDGENIYSNDMFIQQMKKQLGLGENACWFVSEISIRNQDELIFKATIVNTMENVEYNDTKALHAAWESLCPTRVFSKVLTNNEVAKNRIIFGAPGTGKSHKLKTDSEIFGDNMERVTFHPNYSYAQFVGTYKPVMEIREDKKEISYEYVPGPFMRVYVNAKKSMLVNEEYKDSTGARVYYEPATDMESWNLFDKIKCIGDTEYFRATKDMKFGDIALIYIGNNDFGYEKGVYAIAKVISELQIDDSEGDGSLCVLLRFDKISYDKPIISKKVFDQYNTQYQSVHRIEKGEDLLREISFKEEKHLLIIEEINRANVAAVFGDVFQLLDRKNGISEYAIATSEDMRQYLDDELGWYDADNSEMRIPSNMYIWATMNSADQGVFPMDTAFKRRWEFEYLGVDDEEQVEAIQDYVIPMCVDNTYYVNWQELRNEINTILKKEKINEDKLLGPFFVSKAMLDDIKSTKDDRDKISLGEITETEIIEAILSKEKAFIKAFESKVIMYLFEDVMKMRAGKIFLGHDKNKGNMIFSEICKAFEKDGEKIFDLQLEHIE